MLSKIGLRVRLRGDDCVYCGAVAESDEHFPPRSHTLCGFVLPACLECNAIASNVWPEDIVRRAEYVKAKLRTKYARELETPPWDAYELSELGPNMRREVQRWLRRIARVKERIAWNAVSYLWFIDRNNDFVRIDVDKETFDPNAQDWYLKPWMQERELPTPAKEPAIAVVDFW